MWSLLGSHRRLNKQSVKYPTWGISEQQTAVVILWYHPKTSPKKRCNFLISCFWVFFFSLFLLHCPPPPPPSQEKAGESQQEEQNGQGSTPGSATNKSLWLLWEKHLPACTLSFLHGEMMGGKQLPPGSSGSGFSWHSIHVPQQYQRFLNGQDNATCCLNVCWMNCIELIGLRRL